MADEIQTGICEGNWWNSSRSTFVSSACTSVTNDMGSFGWPVDLVDMKVKSSDESSDGSINVFQDLQNPQMMCLGLSSSTTTDWNPSLPRASGTNDRNYNPMLQEDLNYQQDNGVEFSTKNEESLINGFNFKPVNQCFPLDNSFPVSSTSSGYPSTMLQTLFSLPQESMKYPSTTTNYATKLNEYSSSMHKLTSLPKQQPLWNGSSGAPNDIRASFFPSAQSQFLSSTLEQKRNYQHLTPKPNNEEVGDSGSLLKKSSCEPPFKRPRIETPSPMPTFKVRKEKLGDRITALQQLVSPFGKTDTASVLHEAIEYIKLLHDQVSVLSTPYMKNGSPLQHQHTADKLKDTEGTKQDLKSRGLCLVPISITFPVASETTPDFWAPTFGGIFR